MKANLKKRVFCYILDLLIISLMCYVLFLLVPKSTEYISAQNDISILSEKYLNHEISFIDYFNDYSVLAKIVDQNNLVYAILCFVLNAFYFIVVPLFLKGRTVGMVLSKLSLKSKSNCLFQAVLIRSIVAYGMLYYILALILLLIPGNLYFIMLTILAIIQILVVIISIFMVKYRNDKRSLADIFSNSNVFIES